MLAEKRLADQINPEQLMLNVGNIKTRASCVGCKSFARRTRFHFIGVQSELLMFRVKCFNLA
jgi:hypothetical protein